MQTVCTAQVSKQFIESAPPFTVQHVADNWYEVLTIKEATVALEYALKKTRDLIPEYTKDVRDCDDYSDALVVFYKEYVHKKLKKKHAPAIGIVWYTVGGYSHAVCFLVLQGEEGLITVFVEPQDTKPVMRNNPAYFVDPKRKDYTVQLSKI